VPYFGPATNHTSPYWPHFSHFADYVNRATFVLQQGKPVADVAVYLPMEDVMAEAGTEQLPYRDDRDESKVAFGTWVMAQEDRPSSGSVVQREGGPARGK